jgi:hypothetical protein
MRYAFSNLELSYMNQSSQNISQSSTTPLENMSLPTPHNEEKNSNFDSIDYGNVRISNFPETIDNILDQEESLREQKNEKYNEKRSKVLC